MLWRRKTGRNSPYECCHPSRPKRGPRAYSTDRSVRLGPCDDGSASSGERGGTFGCGSVDVDLAQLDRIDGAGAVLLARLLDRLDADGRYASVVEGLNGEAARLIARYRERRTDLPAPRTRAMSLLTRIGALAAHLPGSCLHSAAFDPGWRRAGPRRRFGGHDCYYAYDSACLCRGDLEYTAARPLCHYVTVIMA